MDPLIILNVLSTELYTRGTGEEVASLGVGKAWQLREAKPCDT
jgi:hypothetical protein